MGRRPRTTVHGPRYTERICECIAGLSREEFTLAELVSALPDIYHGVIRVTLRHKVKVGWLERVGRGRYRIGGVRIKTRVSSGIVADALWLALRTAPFGKPLRATEIIGETESLVGRSISHSGCIYTNLLKWTRGGHLERSGVLGEYAYRVVGEPTERPPLCRF